jgi:hypothetical protein
LVRRIFQVLRYIRTFGAIARSVWCLVDDNLHTASQRTIRLINRPTAKEQFLVTCDTN